MTEEEIAIWKEESKKVDPSKCSLRMERQTLHRLERTGAIVFAFKSMMEPLSQLKAEGQGNALAEAILGLAKGNVPAINVYKDGTVWTEPLVEYQVHLCFNTQSGSQPHASTTARHVARGHSTGNSPSPWECLVMLPLPNWGSGGLVCEKALAIWRESKHLVGYQNS